MESSKILSHLKKNPVEFAWVIDDLEKWKEGSQTFCAESSKGLSFVHKSGHPSQRGALTYILSDEGGVIDQLLSHLPKTGYTIRETRTDILPKLQSHIGDAKIYFEQRMDVTHETFKPHTTHKARQLVEADAQALVRFQGAPSQALENFKFWIRGATIFGIFEGDKLISMGSTFNKTSDAWNIVAISTLPEYRGKGHARDVTSALAEAGLEQARAISLTVVKDNAAAIACYSKLGFRAAEDRVWIDNGTGSKP
jgi:ribosomal protein S18 acetylase RimI-like enzyme